ncbi:MAG: hypothetical protein KDN22_27985 [Verrucomicrobiae bacterium]|nr:hypothetical protein [Verrucomicrobiae bacterium]
MVAESSDGMDGVLKGNLDLETQGVEQNDILSTSSKERTKSLVNQIETLKELFKTCNS